MVQFYELAIRCGGWQPLCAPFSGEFITVKFILRIRIWLQKPWFVGVLSVVAILFSARNIVLPLMDISVSNDQLTASGVATGVSVQLLPDSAGRTPGGKVADIAGLRTRYFGDREYLRNPFLFADDPRQPGQLAVSIEPSITRPGGVHPAADVESISPERLFSLNAILVRDGQKYALINRQVSAEGDPLTPGDAAVTTAGLSAPLRQQVQDLMRQEYTLTRIGQHDVEISYSAGDFTVSLGY